MSEPPKIAICLVIDGWHVGSVGAYGNTWINTPELDRLAARSLVLDQAFINRPAEFLHDAWNLQDCPTSGATGGFRAASAPHTSLPACLTARGIHTCLLTDDPTVANHPLADGFTERILLPFTSTDRCVDDAEETQLYAVVAAALAWLEEAKQPYFLWVQTRGLSDTWDAPLELRQQFIEEGDFDLDDDATVPAIVLPHDLDPDQRLAFRHAYGGQALLLDTVLGAFLDALDTLPHGKRALLNVMGAKGFALGEHRAVGLCGKLYTEMVQVPWLIRAADRPAIMQRSSAFVQTSDVTTTIASWFDDRSDANSHEKDNLLTLLDDANSWLRDRVCFFDIPHIGDLGDTETWRDHAIRTPAWFLRLPHEKPPELYAKPDDRWDANDVASRCPEVVAAMQEALATTISAMKEHQSLPPLDDVLVHGLS